MNERQTWVTAEDAPLWVEAETPAAEVARLMLTHDVAVLPVGRGAQLIGMVTDRDLVLQVMAAGRDPLVTQACEVLHNGTVRYESGGRAHP